MGGDQGPGRLRSSCSLVPPEPLLHFILQQQDQLLAEEEQRTVKQDFSGQENPEDHSCGLLTVQLQQLSERSPDKWRSHDKEIAEDLDGKHRFFERGVDQVPDGSFAADIV